MLRNRPNKGRCDVTFTCKILRGNQMTAWGQITVRAVVVDCFNDTCLLLSLQSMKDTTTGADIFSEVLNAFAKFGLDLST